MRDVVAWCLLRPRTWVALASAFLATVLASGDGQPGWTVGVALSTSTLAALSIRAHFLDEHPDWPSKEERKQARLDAWAEEVLRRHRGRPAPRRAVKRVADPTVKPVLKPSEKWERSVPRQREPEPVADALPEPESAPALEPAPPVLSKRDAEVAAIVRRYEEQAAARRAALKPPPSPE